MMQRRTSSPSLRQFRVTTSEQNMPGIRRFRNEVTIYPENRQSLDDIAAVIIDRQILHDGADVIWVFFFFAPERPGSVVANRCVSWIREGADPTRFPRPVKGRLATSESPYREGRLHVADHRAVPR